MEVPMEEPMDEEDEEEPMFEEPLEIEDSDEEPMEEDEQEEQQGGQDGASDLNDGDDPDNSDSDGDDDGDGDDGGDEGDGGGTMRVTTMLHYLLRGGQWRSTKICMVMPTTIQSFSPLYAATTPGALCSTGWSIGPTLTTSAFVRWRCTSVKGVECATSTVLS